MQTLDQLLTPRQLEVCALLAQGLQDKEIAAIMEIGHKTVAAFLSEIRDRTGIEGRILLAMRYRLEYPI